MLYNTGKKIYNTLIQVQIMPNGDRVPTGQTKPNDPEDPDYIAPVDDLTMCPITVPTTTEAPQPPTSTTEFPDIEEVKAYVTIVNTGTKWRATGFLDHTIPVEVKLEGSFYNGLVPLYFAVIIPANSVTGIIEFGDTSGGGVASDVNITIITPSHYLDTDIIPG